MILSCCRIRVRLGIYSVSNAHSIDNDRILAMRFAKQCRVRSNPLVDSEFTPEMIFRFADTSY